MALQSGQVGSTVFNRVFSKEESVGPEGYACICACFIKYDLLNGRSFDGLERRGTRAYPGDSLLKIMISAG